MPHLHRIAARPYRLVSSWILPHMERGGHGCIAGASLLRSGFAVRVVDLNPVAVGVLEIRLADPVRPIAEFPRLAGKVHVGDAVLLQARERAVEIVVASATCVENCRGRCGSGSPPIAAITASAGAAATSTIPGAGRLYHATGAGAHGGPAGAAAATPRDAPRAAGAIRADFPVRQVT